LQFFEKLLSQQKSKDSLFDKFEVLDAEHGRIESQHYWVTDDIGWLEQAKNWAGLKSTGRVAYESVNKATGDTRVELRYFISSLPANAKAFADAVRMHWRVENGLHWCLDVAFNENGCRVRKDAAPVNLAVVRQVALNLLKQKKTAKTGIQDKRLMAGWNHQYLAKLLDNANIS